MCIELFLCLPLSGTKHLNMWKPAGVKKYYTHVWSLMTKTEVNIIIFINLANLDVSASNMLCWHLYTRRCGMIANKTNLYTRPNTQKLTTVGHRTAFNNDQSSYLIVSLYRPRNVNHFKRENWSVVDRRILPPNRFVFACCHRFAVSFTYVASIFRVE